MDNVPIFMPARTDTKLVAGRVKFAGSNCWLLASWRGDSQVLRAVYSQSARTNDSCSNKLNLYSPPTEAVKGEFGWPLSPTMASPDDTTGWASESLNLESLV